MQQQQGRNRVAGSRDATRLEPHDMFLFISLFIIKTNNDHFGSITQRSPHPDASHHSTMGQVTTGTAEAAAAGEKQGSRSRDES